MPRYFSRERFGFPQLIGALLLILFFLQCLWFCAKAPLAETEILYLHPEAAQWMPGAVQPISSPATHTLATVSAFALRPGAESFLNRFVLRLPFLFIATALAASLWYVTRRLFGNAAAYVAMILYVFSPWAVIYGGTVQPGAPASWSVFGMVFTGIAVAHTLYAPREVVLWNWKRILLLAISIGLAVTSLFATILILPFAAAFLLYLAPHRRKAALVILGAACAIGLLVAWIFAGFHLSAIIPAHPAPFDLSGRLYARAISYQFLGRFFADMPALSLLLVGAVIGFIAWRRTRYFSTTAPLIIFAVLILLGIATPHSGAADFFRIALPFAYVFVAGLFADFRETRWSEMATAVVAAILVAHVMFSLIGLIRM